VSLSKRNKEALDCRLTPRAEEGVRCDHRANQDFQFNKSSDFLRVELVGVYFAKLVRAQMEGNVQAAESLDRMIRCHMQDLKTTEIAREGEEPKGPHE
jgi:hypothetical protein